MKSRKQYATTVYLVLDSSYRIIGVAAHDADTGDKVIVITHGPVIVDVVGGAIRGTILGASTTAGKAANIGRTHQHSITPSSSVR